jgi:carbonic anhydrase
MSTPVCNAPINIPSPSDPSITKCDIRCNYTYNYLSSDCNASVKTNYISLSYQTFSTSQAKYNGNDYWVEDIRIYYPSIHKYNGSTADAEMVMIHNSIVGKKIAVCAPIVQSSLVNKASEKLSFLMNLLKDTTNTKIHDFYSLNTFLDHKPFYTYEGTLFDDCSQKINYVVYRPADFQINITSEAFSQLTKITKTHTYKTSTNTTAVLFYNSRGSKPISSGDQIYIDCQPINKSEEEVTMNKEVYSTPHKSISFSFSQLKQSQLLQLLLCFIIFIVIIYIFYYSVEITNSIFGKAND